MLANKATKLIQAVVFLAIALLAVVGQARAACPDYALVVARGTGEPQGPSVGFSGVGINGMVNQTLSAAPSGIEYDVEYPADASPTSPDEGRDDAVQYINNARHNCPQQKFALLGYSQGATVALKVLQHFSQNNQFISAVVFLGNPYQKAGQNSTVDETGGSGTRQKNGALYKFEPSLALSNRLDRSGKVLNICYTKDLVCTGVALNTLNGNHFADDPQDVVHFAGVAVNIQIEYPDYSSEVPVEHAAKYISLF